MVFGLLRLQWLIWGGFVAELLVVVVSEICLAYIVVVWSDSRREERQRREGEEDKGGVVGSKHGAFGGGTESVARRWHLEDSGGDCRVGDMACCGRTSVVVLGGGEKIPWPNFCPAVHELYLGNGRCLPYSTSGFLVSCLACLRCGLLSGWNNEISAL